MPTFFRMESHFLILGLILMVTAIIYVVRTGTESINPPKLQKDVLSCSFTEPYIKITFDAATGKVIEKRMDRQGQEKQEFVAEVIAENGKFVAAGPDGEHGYENSFKLYDDKNQVILEATLDFKGSDAMAEDVYPFSAVYGQESHQRPLHGGCQTKAAPAVDPLTLIQSLKR